MLEVGNSIVYGLEQFYDLIASAEGETSFLVHSPKCKPKRVAAVLGPALPIPGQRQPGNLEGNWQTSAGGSIHLGEKSGSCITGDKYEFYRYQAYYEIGVQSWGYIRLHCQERKLAIVSEKYGFQVSGVLNHDNYMVWNQVPVLGRKYDFHIWR